MHDVIAAITTAPWSRTNSPRSSDLTVDRLARPAVRSRRPPRARDGVVVGERQRPPGRWPGRTPRRPRRAWCARRGMLLLDVVVDVLAERRLRVGQRDAVLRALGPGDRRHHVGQVQLDVLGELRLTLGVVPHALFLGVRLDQRQLLLAAAGHPQVVDGDLVDREDRCGGAEFGAHVAQRGAVGQRHLGDTLAVELDELADHAVLAQHLGDGEHHVGGGHAGLALAGQLEPDDAGDQHRHRLAQHRGLGLDAADAPAQHAEAVLHRGVAVGAHAGVGVGHPVALHHDARQVLDVDLVHDAGARRHHLEVVEGALAPAQELVALAVALVLDLDVALERVRACRTGRRSPSGRSPGRRAPAG